MALDEVKENTKLTNHEDRSNDNYIDGEADDYDDADSINTYNDGELGEDLMIQDDESERNLNNLKYGDDLRKGHKISSRAMDRTSLFRNDDSRSESQGEQDQGRQNEAEENITLSDRRGYEQCTDENEYRTILAFIGGATLSRAAVEDETDHDDSFAENESSEPNRSEKALFTEDEWNSLNTVEGADLNSVPTMKGVSESVVRERGISLDRTQYVAYEIICSTFLLDVLKQCWDDNNPEISGYAAGVRPVLDEFTLDVRERIVNKLYELGAKEQLIMFMTGPAGAGKSTSIEVAQQFCFEFCRSLSLMWNSNTFLFTALSGCAAALFGGVTTHSAAFLCSQAKNVTTEMVSVWKDVKVLIVDEISFGTVGDIEKLNDRLNMIRRKLMNDMMKSLPANMIFGGYSVIFSGDFRQIPPVSVTWKNTLWKNPGLWDTAINVVIILDNSHRFKDDPEYGAILKRMWNGTFTKCDCDTINQRIIGQSVKLPDTEVDSDISYACWSNNERSTVHASLFQDRIKDFPVITSDELPPEHTVIIEADVGRASGRKPRHTSRNVNAPLAKSIPVSRNLKRRIFAKLCDSDVRQQKKGVDPALKLYVGCNCMVNNNEDIKSGLANGSLCRVVSIKMKEGTSRMIRNYDGKKVYAINAADLDYVEFEHFPKKNEQLILERKIRELERGLCRCTVVDEFLAIEGSLGTLKSQLKKIISSRRFRLSVKRYYCTFDVNKLGSTPDMGSRGLRKSKHVLKHKPEWKKITVDQLPVNTNDGTTAHKLQGSSKVKLIVHNWKYSHGWVYTVLSRVRTIKGLFLSKKLEYRNGGSYYRLPRELIAFENRMRSKIPDKIANHIS